ncbi:MAG: FRG domain-containing protein [Segetibacter sp.]
MTNKQEICRIADLMDAIVSTSLAKQGHSHLKIWICGHEDEKYKLQPGVYRDNFLPGANQEQRLKTEQHLSQDFRIYSSGLRESYLTNSQIYFLQQHYGMPTRLLDWSNDPLAALFFAVNNETHDNKNGSIFIMEAYQLTEHQNAQYIDKDKNKKDFRGIATGENPVFKSALNVINSWLKPSDFPDFIIPVRSDFFDKRTKTQRSCFTFHVPGKEMLNENHNHTLKEFLIPMKAKKEIRDELTLLGIDHFKICGDLNSLSKTLKINYCK